MFNGKQIVSVTGHFFLFCLAWLATAFAVRQCNWLASTVKIEAPSWWFPIQSLTPTLPLSSALVLMFWLQRDAAPRLLAGLGAALSLIFCFLGVHALWWLTTWLLYAPSRPIFALVGSPMLWREILIADVALTLSFLSLYLCIRASKRLNEARLKSARNWQTASSP